MSIVIVVCLLLAVVAGLVANRFVRPFAKSGVQGVKLERVAADLGEDYPEDHPGRPLPCDEQGRPTAAFGLRES